MSTNTPRAIEELRQLAEAIKQWGNTDDAWLDEADADGAAVVGHISEDGEHYPTALVDLGQYFEPQDSIKLAKFYAAANPAAILELLAERDALRAELESEREESKRWHEKASLERDARETLAATNKALSRDLERIRTLEPVAWLYTLEYGKAISNIKASHMQLNYPFGVCGADYLQKNDDGVSYVRQTPLFDLTQTKEPTT